MRALFAVFLALLVAVAVVSASPSAAPPSTPPLYTAIVFRHGHRAPIDRAPNFGAAWDASGYVSGELTTVGIQMHKAFGRFLRETYVMGAANGNPQPLAYLPYNYSYSTLNIRSTDVDRCLMSVTSLLSELYPGIPVCTVLFCSTAYCFAPIPPNVS